MTTVFLAPIGNGFNFATTGWLPLNEGRLYTYLAGTTTPQPTWTTHAGNVENANPIILGVDGRPPYEIWLAGSISYKFILMDADDNPIQTYDDLIGIGQGDAAVAYPFVDWFDQSLTNSGLGTTGTIDTTIAPYSNNAAAGNSTLISFPNTVDDAGIWVLGSVSDPSAVPVTRRSDSDTGSAFDMNQVIPLNPANVIANDATFCYCFPWDASYSTRQMVGIIGTDFIEFYPATLGDYAQVAGGTFNKASGFESFVAAGTLNIVTGVYAASVAGRESTASGNSALVSGFQCDASGDYSRASGYQAVTRGITGADARAVGGVALVAGTLQYASYCLQGQTIGNVSSQLCADNTNSATTTNQVTLPNHSTYAFEGRVCARHPATGDAKDWSFVGTIARGANVGSTALVTSCTPTVVNAAAGAGTWALVIAADTTHGCLAVTFTGEAAKTINIVCRVDTVENVG